MKRRSFIELTGGAVAMAAAATPADKEAKGHETKFYLVENYFLRQSTQLARINDFMGGAFLPFAQKAAPGPKIFLEALVAPHMPQFMVVMGLKSVSDLPELRAKMRQDSAVQKAFAAWESGSEPPYEHMSHTLLKATDYSPEPPATPRKPGASRIFEWRVYHSPTWRQLGALHQRFAGPEIKIFHRVGVHPILYSETVIGPNMPNLTYLTPFDNLAAREKAWEAFGADPEWIKVRKDSIDAHGQISSVIQISLWRPAAYSPIG
ncbi:MAG: NIPSNAP family protein [Bryobacteraceae bacterium]